jgi:hypothetical protein
VGEFDFGDLDVDLRGGYANSQRNAPYERSFNYVYDSTVGDYVNNLTTNPQSAGITFSELDEDVWNVGGDLSYTVPGSRNLTLSAGGAYLDTKRGSTRRDFAFRPASALPGGVTQQRPDFLLSDFNVYTYNILLVETSALPAPRATRATCGSRRATAGHRRHRRRPAPPGRRPLRGRQAVGHPGRPVQPGRPDPGPGDREELLASGGDPHLDHPPDMQLRLHGSRRWPGRSSASLRRRSISTPSPTASSSAIRS